MSPLCKKWGWGDCPVHTVGVSTVSPGSLFPLPQATPCSPFGYGLSHQTGTPKTSLTGDLLDLLELSLGALPASCGILSPGGSTCHQPPHHTDLPLEAHLCVLSSTWWHLAYLKAHLGQFPFSVLCPFHFTLVSGGLCLLYTTPATRPWQIR